MGPNAKDRLGADVRGNHLSNTACLTRAFFKSDTRDNSRTMMILDTTKDA